MKTTEDKNQLQMLIQNYQAAYERTGLGIFKAKVTRFTKKLNALNK